MTQSVGDPVMHDIRCRCGAVMVMRSVAGFFRCPRAQGAKDPNHSFPIPIEVADADVAAILANERGCCE